MAVASGPPKQVSGKCFLSPFEIAGDAFDHQLFESIRWLQPRSGRGERFRSERRAKVVEERRRLCYVPTRRGGEVDHRDRVGQPAQRSEEHTSELQSLMRISYTVFCLKKKNTQ